MFDRILCAIDFSDYSRAALACALATARLYNGRVTVLHVASAGAALASVPASSSLDPRALLPIDSPAILKEMSDFVARTVGERGRADLRVAAGAAWRGIVEEAALSRAGLIVLGTHGRSGFDRLLFGSVADKVLRKAPCPVLTVPPPEASTVVTATGAFTRIVCGVDFSDVSMAALAAAIDIADRSGATLLVVHVLTLPDSSDPAFRVVGADQAFAAHRAECTRRLHDAVPERLRQRCIASTLVGGDTPHREIVRLATTEFADLIVVGMRGRGALSRWALGATAEQVAHHAGCPVLTVGQP